MSTKPSQGEPEARDPQALSAQAAARAQGRAAIDAFLADSRAWSDAALARVLPPAALPPARLHEALRYAAFGEGKRLRPAVLRLVCTHFGGDDADAVLPAAAIECVHTYSLVHDDLPCMDDDDLRRGRPTVHKVYGEALGVLAGDALLTLAFALVARCGPWSGELAGVLAEAAGSCGMVGGQVLDLEGSARAAVPSRMDVDEIHLLKTAALLGAAAEMGAVAARARAPERAAAQAYGLALGRCFQAVDDILDVTGDAATLGKTPGKDQRAGKATLVAALGLEGAQTEARRLGQLARDAAAKLGAGPGDLPFELVERLLRRRS